MGVVDDLIVAGSHGFDIWAPRSGEIHAKKGLRARGLSPRSPKGGVDDAPARGESGRRIEGALGWSRRS